MYQGKTTSNYYINLIGYYIPDLFINRYRVCDLFCLQTVLRSPA
nr:MAG TPA: hypothetical protein [Caudoviricetes sp.]